MNLLGPLALGHGDFEWSKFSSQTSPVLTGFPPGTLVGPSVGFVSALPAFPLAFAGMGGHVPRSDGACRKLKRVPEGRRVLLPCPQFSADFLKTGFPFY